MGEVKIVSVEFATGRLTQMAKYRNRLVHFYAEVKPDELYEIINNNMGDFDIFLSSVKEVLENPQKFNLEVE